MSVPSTRLVALGIQPYGGSTFSAVGIVDTIAALKARSVSGLGTGYALSSSGYYAKGDRGGGLFYYDSTSSATDDGGSVIQPTVGAGRWLRVIDQAVNVRWFGAKGDGATDDIVAINKAVAFLVSKGGGQLYFPAATYMVSTAVLVRDSIEYFGDGKNSIIKARSNSLDNVIHTSGESEYASYVYGATIRDLTIDGNSANVSYNTLNAGDPNDAFQNGLRLQRARNFKVERVYFQNIVFNGLSIYFDSQFGTVRDCYFSTIGKTGTLPAAYSYNAIFLEYATRFVSVENNYINGTRQAGILVQNSSDGYCSDIRLAGNRIYNCVNQGIWCRGVTGATFTFMENFEISGNTLQFNSLTASEPAIRFDLATAVPWRSIQIVNNIIKDNGNAGINMGTGLGTYPRVLIQGNTIVDNTAGNGIVLTSTVDSAIVVGNVILGNAVAISDASTNVVNYMNETGAGSVTPQNLKTSSAAAFATVGLYNAALRSTAIAAVSTTDVTISTLPVLQGGGLFVVIGDDGLHGFSDLVLFTFGAVAVISSTTAYGSPPARTYSAAGTACKLRLASSTLSVRTAQMLALNNA